MNKSSMGDWLFLIGGVGLISGYILYENQEQMDRWLTWFQSPSVPTGDWLIANWGLLLLLGAIIFAGYKLWGADTAVAANSMSSYKPVAYVNVRLVR